jgi:hypothetical protein
MRSKMSFSKLTALICIIAISLFALPAPANSQDQSATKCNFKTYSIDERDTEHDNVLSTAELKELPYSVATLAPFLKLISPDYELDLVKPGQADVSITYLRDGGWYKTALAEKHPTTLDFLAAFPDTSSDVRTLSSPWLRLRLTVDCKLVVVFIYGMRQLIADQAFLSGVRPVIEGVVTSADEPTRAWWMDYMKSVVFLEGHPKGNSNLNFRNEDEIYERQEFVKRQIAHEYPPDLFWFFSRIKSHKLMTDTGTFSYQLGFNLDKLRRHSEPAQAELVLAIIKSFLSGNATHQKYNTIFDVKSLINLRSYQIRNLGRNKN